MSLSTTKSGYINGGSSWASKNPDNVKLATRPELVERFCCLIDFAIDFILHCDTSDSNYLGPPKIEEDLIFNIISLSLDETKLGLDVAMASESTKLKGFYTNKQKLKTKLLSLINFCLSAAMPHRIRLRMVRHL